jgi:hypothetical protein
MPRRKIELDVKVAALRESLRLANLEDVMDKYHVSKPAMYNWYHEVLESLPATLANAKPGPKSGLEKEKVDSPF